MAAQDKALHILHRHVQLPGDKGAEARRVQHARLAEHAVFRERADAIGQVDHRVERVADQQQDALRRVAHHLLDHGQDNTGILVHQVIARHDKYVVVEKVGPAGEVAEQLEGEPNPATATVEVDGRDDHADEA